MSYSIIRMQKMKSLAIKGIQFHNQREKESQTNPDIDSEKTHLNYDLVNDKEIDYNVRINQVINDGLKNKKKVRKDAVKLAEFLITSDKGFFDKLSPVEQKRFFQTAYDFLSERYGKQNLVYATVHNDEKTPHMHVGFVPITEDGRLSAKDYFGNRMQLIILQDDFNKKMKDNGFDLERGISSNRKHIETAKYKVLTAQQLEYEVVQKQAELQGRIAEIDSNMKDIKEIESKKILGYVGIKEKDYTELVAKAEKSVLYEAEAKFLESELVKAKEDVKKLQNDLQSGQDIVRKQYRQVALESEELKTNFAEAVNNASVEQAKDLVIQMDKENREKYNELVKKHNNVVALYREKEEENKALKVENGVLKSDVKFLEKEIYILNDQVKHSNKKYNDLVEEFSKYKERVNKTLNRLFDWFKTFLRVQDVDKEVIQQLETKRAKVVSEQLKEVENPRQREQQTLER